MEVLFSNEEEELIYRLAEKLTGSCQKGQYRREILATNVARRVAVTKCSSLNQYLHFAKNNKEEYAQLLSSLTIHTTSWFREAPHFKKLEKYLLENYGSETFMAEPFRIWCSACSTGEEVYSFALVLEKFQDEHPYFNYQIFGSDIDPISVQKAARCAYSKNALKDIPKEYYKYLLAGKNRANKHFTVIKKIKDKCSFRQADLAKTQQTSNVKYDAIICRNVLIYFTKESVDKIIKQFVEQLVPRGILFLGHSEIIDYSKYSLFPKGHSTYYKISSIDKDNTNSKNKILVVDDSAVVRKTLTKLLANFNYEVISASSANEASLCLKQNSVDLITLDLRMPEIDGPTWLKKARAQGLKTPVVIVSEASPSEALEVLGALDNGAQDYCEKSSIQNNPQLLIEKFDQIIDTSTKQNNNLNTNKKKFKSENKLNLFYPEIILIGASTGGTEALSKLLKNFTLDSPPVVVVQHISPSFAKPFAERLAQVSGIKLGESNDNTILEKGKIYLAHGDYHIAISKKGKDLSLRCNNSPSVSGHRPSVDFLFKSVATLNCKTMAILLTGMGKDGAQGMSELCKNGAITIAQDEESCIVFGMPKEAIKLGATRFVGNIKEIREQMESALKCKK